jgi:2-polyprenyl-6-hydroxyphenyl methylase/3-demethylubiquinone-9 3-methyltransferase
MRCQAEARHLRLDKVLTCDANAAMAQTSASGARTIDPAEVERFARMAREWWDPNGKFRPLHKLGPARLQFIRDRIAAHWRRDTANLRPLAGLTVLDIGCGGGLVSEPMTRLGATVTGIDPAAESIAAASAHARESGLDIDYRAVTVETLLGEGHQFDAVLCLEVVEHVPDPAAFLKLCAGLIKPGGLLVASTINRTMKAYALAILGAEYVLRWLPVGTHQWERFVTPDELARYCAAAGLGPAFAEGLFYNPLADRWSLSTDTDVNYMAAAAKPV